MEENILGGIIMKNCPNCGEILGDSVEICYACRYSNKLRRVLTMEESRQLRDNRQEIISQKQSESEDRENQRKRRDQTITDIKNKKVRFLCNTGYQFEGYHIKEYIDIVSSEIALGTGFMSELSASIHDSLGTQSNTIEEKLGQAKNKALNNLIEKAMEKGANALIGLNYDTFTLTNNMLVVSINATAVYIEK